MFEEEINQINNIHQLLRETDFRDVELAVEHLCPGQRPFPAVRSICREKKSSLAFLVQSAGNR